MIETIGGRATVYVCPNECLKSLHLTPRAFDVVIADLSMPKLNGLDFLRLSSAALLNVPRKFLMTGLAEIDGKNIEPDSDVEVLLKPCSVDVLIKKLGHSHN